MRGRGQGSAVAVAARWSRGGERIAVRGGTPGSLRKPETNLLFRFPLFRRGDYIFIVRGLYQ
jgi:hypothetical protein